MEGFSSGLKECGSLEKSDMRALSNHGQSVVGLPNFWPAVAVVGFLTALAACSPEGVAETRATLDLSFMPQSTSTLEPQILGPENASCVNDARFVEDLTIPDGYQVKRGEVLDKRWEVLNSGSCDWGAGYRLIRIDDGLLEAPRELALYPARAGETGIWSVQVTAPDQAGDQLASWQAQSPEGNFFGDQVFVLIEVGP